MSPHAATSRIETNSAIATGVLVHSGGDDDADADRHRADEYRQRDVFLLDDLLPQVVRRQAIDDRERNDEDGDADEREYQGSPDVLDRGHHFPPVRCPHGPYTRRYEPGLSRTDFGVRRPGLINGKHRRP